MSTVACMVLGATGGALTSMAYNLIPVVQLRATRRGHPIQPGIFLNCMYVILNLSGILLCIVGSKLGPVAISMPCTAAASLLLNMFVQGCTGLAVYSKEMRVGTIVLCLAVGCLGEVGPEEPETQVVVSGSDLLRKPPAFLWIGFLLVSMVLGAIVIMQGSERVGKGIVMAVLAYIVANSTALGTSLGKLLLMNDPFFPLKLCFGVIFLIMGIVSLGGGAKASKDCDMALFLPLQQCLQLIINALTGLALWGDGPHIKTPTSYALTLIIICLGVYLNASSVDIVQTWQERRSRIISTSGIHTNEMMAPLGTANESSKWSVEEVARSWEEDPKTLGAKLQGALEEGHSAGFVDVPRLAELCGMFGSALGEMQAGKEVEHPSRILRRWRDGLNGSH